MSDSDLLLRKPDPPEPSEKKPHRITIRLDLAALVLSLLAAGFTGWQAFEAHKQRVAAEKATEDAATIAKTQLDEARKARIAAENSAAAAERSAGDASRLADAAQQNAIAASDSAKVNRGMLLQSVQALHLQERPTLVITGKQYEFFDSSGHGSPILSYRTTVLNRGKTSALQLRAACYATSGMAHSAPWRNQPGVPNLSVIEYGPFEVLPDTPLDIYAPFPPEEKRPRVITVDCRVTYTDRFVSVDRVPHSLTFCYRFDDIKGRAVPDSCGISTE